MAEIQPARTASSDPRLNPSYPKRVHTAEKTHWDEEVRRSDEMVAQARLKLEQSGGDRSVPERTYAQMLGARDQIAEVARRLPGEVGALYEEDRHRLEEALMALERLARRFDL